MKVVLIHHSNGAEELCPDAGALEPEGPALVGVNMAEIAQRRYTRYVIANAYLAFLEE